MGYRGSVEPLCEACVKSGKEVQLLAGLEAHGLAGGDGDLGPGARVAPDTCFAWLYCEYAEATELDAIT